MRKYTAVPHNSKRLNSEHSVPLFEVTLLNTSPKRALLVEQHKRCPHRTGAHAIKSANP